MCLNGKKKKQHKLLLNCKHMPFTSVWFFCFCRVRTLQRKKWYKYIFCLFNGSSFTENLNHMRETKAKYYSLILTSSLKTWQSLLNMGLWRQKNVLCLTWTRTAPRFITRLHFWCLHSHWNKKAPHNLQTLYIQHL